MLGATKRNEAIWDVVIERMQKKLAPWKRVYLNRAGRITLIKNSLSSLPTYYLSLLHMPVKVEERLNSIMGRFLWGEEEDRRKMTWVAWAKICRPVEKGGLGVRNLRDVNRSLLAKWHWRYAIEKRALWRRIISEKTRSGENFLMQLKAQEPVGRSMWLEIEGVKEDFFSCVEVQVGNGRDTRFWLDWWRGKYAFATKYSRLFRLSTQQEASVADMKPDDWSFTFRRVLNPAESIDLLELRYELREVVLRIDEEDKLQGDFTAKKMYTKSMERYPDCSFHRLLGGKHIPPKISFIVWAGLQDSLPTRQMLQHRGINIPSNLCLFCGSSVECVNHLLLHCDWAMHLWNYFMNAWSVGWVMPGNLEGQLQSWRIRKFSSKKLSLWYMVPYAIIWTLWKQRNNRHYGRKIMTKDEMVTAVKLDLCFWGSMNGLFMGYSMTQVLNHWETFVNL